MLLLDIGLGGNFPIKLAFYLDGKVALHPSRALDPIVDQVEGGVTGLFDNKGFSLIGLGEKEPLSYQYGVPYNYKEMPLLKAWLVQQQLAMSDLRRAG